MKKHPVRQCRGKSLWFGPEVEGCHIPAHTAFVRRKLGRRDFARVVNEPGLQQLFLTEGFQDWKWLQENASALPKLLILTKAVHARDYAKLPKWVRTSTRIKLFVRIEARWILKLRAGDQISIGVPYDLFSARIDRMVRTMPQDYENDYA